jgi:AcrR family transcriptional regulator
MTRAAAPRFRRYSSEERAGMLVEAGLACLAEGGISAFTVDNICRRAAASRGLIAHHFGSKDNLLAAVYEAAYQPMIGRITPTPGADPLPLGALLDAMFDAENYTRESLNIWLALWGETAVNPALQAAHRHYYGIYRDTVAAAIARIAARRGLTLDAAATAATVIALVDGLWLEQCIDPGAFDAARARAACRGLLQPLLGDLE